MPFINNIISDEIQKLFEITRNLEREFPGRKFTIDGHLVGSIGEVIVAENYGLELLPNSTQTHDARSKDGRLVQIKATQINRISISSKPEYMIVIQLFPDGTWTEIYNGKGKLVWDNAGKMQKNGQRPISVSKLKTLMQYVNENDKIKRIE